MSPKRKNGERGDTFSRANTKRPSISALFVFINKGGGRRARMQICQFEQINRPVIDVVPRLMPRAEGRRPRGLQGVIEPIARLQVQQTERQRRSDKDPSPTPTGYLCLYPTRCSSDSPSPRTCYGATAQWRVDPAAEGRTADGGSIQ